jgi:2-aminobenzoate-CoA ligase
MAKLEIPQDYLPPKNIWPEYLVPEEFKDIPTELNFAHCFLDRHIHQGRGNDIAIKLGDKNITYVQLQEMVNRFGNALKDAGVKPGDRIGFRLVNSIEALVTIFAVWKIGAIPVPTSPLWSRTEVEFTVNDSEMKYFVVSKPLMDVVKEVKPNFRYGTKVIVIGGNPKEVKEEGDLVFEEMLEAGSDKLEPFMLDGDDISVILYTSGTTGLPKGCVHFVRPLLIHAIIINRYVWKLKPGDVIGGPAPVSFAAGFGTFAVIPWVAGATVSLIPKFTPQDMLEIIQKHKITVLTGLPTAYRAMMNFPDFKKYDLSSVRLCTSGGDALGVETLKRWQDLTGMPIWEGLGTTELFHLITSNCMNDKPVPGSVGKPLPGVQARVVDEDGKDCKPNEMGSLLIKAPTGTLYWKPYADNGKLLKKQQEGVVKGWNKVGDVVYAIEDGNLFFVSREDDMIKTSGYRVVPQEIEEAICKHPAIKEACVVGVPDPIKGQILKAFVVLKPGYSPSDDFFEELKEFLKKHIAIYKLPRAIAYVDSLPRTPTGKLLRRVLREAG